MLNVLLTQAIDVDATQAGMTFKALVDDPVMLGGKVVVPRNAAVVVQVAKVEQAGKIKGADKMSLKANTLSFGGRKVRHRHGVQSSKRARAKARRPRGKWSAGPAWALPSAASRAAARARPSARLPVEEPERPLPLRAPST